MDELRRDPPVCGELVVEHDEGSQKHYGRGEHFITRPAPGRVLLPRPDDSDGITTSSLLLKTPGFLRWCRSKPGEGLRCGDRGTWVTGPGEGTSRITVTDADNWKFLLTTEGA
jgi:hypothetical protein